MPGCPFCHTSLSDHDTFCYVCGYSLISSLPGPVCVHGRFYFALALFSVFSGILACACTFSPHLYLGSLLLVLAAIASAGTSLEKAWGRADARSIRILAILGLFFGVLGFVFFMFINSNVPGIGYSM
ncbi:MAG: hypothetical protein WCE90_00505 [Candidatus Zixiibacteriota bacterium]